MQRLTVERREELWHVILMKPLSINAS